MTLRFALVVFVVSLAGLAPARAERLVRAYDPRLHTRPPTMRGVDGQVGELMLDADVVGQPPPTKIEQTGVVGALGEVVVVQGDDQIVLPAATGGLALTQTALPQIAKRVIAQFGDNFEAITLWLTFDDRGSPNAEAYEQSTKNDIEGIGLRNPVRDNSRAYGSNGVLRSMLNMKTVGLAAGDTMETWQTSLETWGQESGHRWMAFMQVRDPRTGRITDNLLARQCSHYGRYVDTQASVHDGYAWRDNGNGTFTWTERWKRYGNLDLYGMGLLLPDEFPSFFYIDDIPNYRYPASCNDQPPGTPNPIAQTISGTRVNITIDDVIAANGERKAPEGQRQDYWREAEVVVTQPSETPSSPRVQALAARINRARLFWETWVRGATGNRLVMCTQISGDCGDPRSDVTKVTFNGPGKSPTAGAIPLDVEIANSGTRAATGVKATIELTINGTDVKRDTKDVGMLDPGATKVQTFNVDMRGTACGAEVKAKVTTQSDFHYSRNIDTYLLGAQTTFKDGFEADSGWTINPDGDDSAAAAQWERGRPEATLILNQLVQPAITHAGTGAWVTGLAAVSTGARATLVRDGKSTLQSPLYDTKDLRDPILRYWVSFAGVRADASGNGLEPSAMSRLVVQARGVDMTTPTASTPWMQVDALDNLIAPDWQRRGAPLPKELAQKPRIQLRFVATESNPDAGGVEAAIDDIEITTNLQACYDPVKPGGGGGGGGCGCTLGAKGEQHSLVLVLVLVLGLARRTRRASAP